MPAKAVIAWSDWSMPPLRRGRVCPGKHPTWLPFLNLCEALAGGGGYYDNMASSNRRSNGITAIVWVESYLGVR